MVVSNWVLSTYILQTDNFTVKMTRAMATRARRAHRGVQPHTRTSTLLATECLHFRTHTILENKTRSDAVSPRNNLTYKHLEYVANRMRIQSMVNLGQIINRKCLTSLYFNPKKH